MASLKILEIVQRPSSIIFPESTGSHGKQRRMQNPSVLEQNIEKDVILESIRSKIHLTIP